MRAAADLVRVRVGIGVRVRLRVRVKVDWRHALMVELLDRGVDLVAEIAEGREAKAPG